MSKKSLKIILAAGGTGGHMFPAEATARALLAQGHQPILMTDPRGSSFKAADLEAVPIHRIRASSPSGGGILNKAKAFWELFKGSNDAAQIYNRIKPDAVIGFGGYPSVPAIYAAGYKKIPTFIHEQNAVLGRANRLFSKKVRAIFTAYDDIEKIPANFEGTLIKVGNPVRPDFEILRDQPIAPKEDLVNLLITGGSQGAAIFAQIIPEAISLLAADLQSKLHVTQQVPEEAIEKAQQNYRKLQASFDLHPFIDNMPEQLHKADFVICRAGASTIAENIIIGRAGLYIPYPYALDDHQAKNATSLIAANAGYFLRQEEASSAKIAEILQDVILQHDKRLKMQKNAADLGIPKAADKLVIELEKLLIPTPLTAEQSS